MTARGRSFELVSRMAHLKGRHGGYATMAVSRLPRVVGEGSSVSCVEMSTCLDVSLCRRPVFHLIRVKRSSQWHGQCRFLQVHLSTPNAGPNPRLRHPAAPRYHDGFSLGRTRLKNYLLWCRRGASTLELYLSVKWRCHPERILTPLNTVPSLGPGFLVHARRQGGILLNAPPQPVKRNLSNVLTRSS